MKIICIPVRLNSTRLKNKALISIKGSTILEHTINAALTSYCDIVAVVSDSQRVIDAVEAYTARGDRVVGILDRNTYENGTDRIAGGLCSDTFYGFMGKSDPKYTEKLGRSVSIRPISDGDIIMNLQCDMIGIYPSLLNSLLLETENLYRKDPTGNICVTAVRPCRDQKEFDNPNRVKAFRCHQSYLSFSRTAEIPDRTFRVGDRIEVRAGFRPHIDLVDPQYRPFLGMIHIGIYCFTFSTLCRYYTSEHCVEEKEERLEQLRFVHHRIPIHAAGWYLDPPKAIDSIEDVPTD